ncbi:hypothetical protein SynBIOSE41_01752 [Synechococcus sp. BIOS-E4-1]|nr:hypothetical protein SynBIOSE41_01752 [Synechococcus sp. BIOS-E4-1]
MDIDRTCFESIKTLSNQENRQKQKKTLREAMGRGFMITIINI